MNNELFLVEFYVNPDENEWEPNVILGIPFLRLARSIVDFSNVLLTIWPDATIIHNDLQNLDELFAGICEDDLPPLLDNIFTLEAPEFECKMGKSKRVKNKPQPIYKIKYGDEGPSLTINRPITRDELTKEEMEADVYARIMLLNEKRPIIETLKHADKHKKILDSILMDRLKMDGEVEYESEEEAATHVVRGYKVLRELDDPRMLCVSNTFGR